MRVYDENAIPGVGAQKTIHHRNKSSPALSATSQAGGLKVAAKRTAFADLSNTANVLRPSKDDSALGGKGDFRLKENLPSMQEKKQTTLQRPAQRPVSITGLKGLLNSVTSNTSQHVVKQPLGEVQQQLAQPANVQPSNNRKVTSKKSVAAFKDRLLAQHSQSKLPATEAHRPLTSTAPVPPSDRDLPLRPTTNASENDPEPQHPLQKAGCKCTDDPEIRGAQPVPSSLSTVSDRSRRSTSDGIYIDDCGEVKIYSYQDSTNYHDEPADFADNAGAFRTTAHYSSTIPLANQAPVNQSVEDYSEPIQKQKSVQASELEEYWEEEDTADGYEEGYVTAPSFKSRGDNTTGGATTVLFPKETQKAEREIALAKELIERSKTVEELEDEAWDTTMVAEYGEEIFQYMKELEVNKLHLVT